MPGGGRLAEIQTERQNDAIYEEAKKVMVTGWIGLTDRAEEGEWVWSSGETATFTNWARMPGEEPMPYNYKGVDQNGGKTVHSSTLIPQQRDTGKFHRNGTMIRARARLVPSVSNQHA